MARILVVEDERSILQLVCEVLTEAGHEVTPAGHGAEAVQLLEESGTPDLVVLDMWMPVMNGWQFAEAIHARGIDVPIVVMTAAREARQRAQEVGAVGYIGKPFDVDQFTETVERAIETRRSHSQSSEQPDGMTNQALVATQPTQQTVLTRLLLGTMRKLTGTRKDRSFSRAF